MDQEKGITSGNIPSEPSHRKCKRNLGLNGYYGNIGIYMGYRVVCSILCINIQQATLPHSSDHFFGALPGVLPVSSCDHLQDRDCTGTTSTFDNNHGNTFVDSVRTALLHLAESSSTSRIIFTFKREMR
ncbi:unnamed protein product [Enterobius vermicularis]|uniref:Uncharacterized protein n=1 Tax=Enterobius vermicularis TaxID=51028 RepID=A0A0N4UUT0_ENTVE|nr:unnamed protein product [Enterobius vermicularis]